MSRIGRKPVSIPSGVQVTLKEKKLTVKGPKGELSRLVPDLVDIKVDKAAITFERKGDDGPTRARTSPTW